MWRLTGGGSLLKGNLVKVCVGNKRKSFDIHGKLLASSCTFFYQKVKAYGDYGDIIYLVEHDPSAFELFVNWLYRKTLPRIDGNDENRAKEQVGHCIALYLMAETWAIGPLKNLIIDTIKTRQTCNYGWFPAKHIKKIYAATAKGSPLRRYIVDYFLFKTSTMVWGEAERAIMLRTHAEAGNTEFLLECYEGLFKMAYKSKMKDRDPNRHDRCAYHEHELGKSCED